MGPHDRPWWASAGEAADPPDANPARGGSPDAHVDAHRAARRGTVGAGQGEDAVGDGSPPPDEDRSASSTEGHVAEVCGVCPICVLARSIGDARPELLAHLTQAAHHLAAAARSVLETSPPPRTDAPVERIDLDRRGGS